MKALIDADSLLYKAGFTFEDKTNWNELEQELGIENEPSISITTELHSAKEAIDGFIENIKFKTGCEELELWLTGDNNFRFDILPTYKHNRKDSRKPADFDKLWEYLLTKYKANVTNGYEADDMVVYLKTTYPDRYFLCAIDKDVLYQTVGYHYNYGNDWFITTDELDAIKFLYKQVLMGDTVDGYVGVKGIGRIKADRLLQPCTTEREMYEVCVETAKEVMKLTQEEAEDYILTMLRVADMHQLQTINNNQLVIKYKEAPKK